MSEKECIACKWSGVDDQMYSAYGCPSCTCTPTAKAQSDQSLDEAAQKYGEDVYAHLKKHLNIEVPWGPTSAAFIKGADWRLKWVLEKLRIGRNRDGNNSDDSDYIADWLEKEAAKGEGEK